MARRQRRDLSVFESSCRQPTCLPHTMEASHCPFNCWTSSREAMNTNIYSLWFDPTGNRTRVYRFSSTRSIHSTTDRLPMATKLDVVLNFFMYLVKLLLSFLAIILQNIIILHAWYASERHKDICGGSQRANLTRIALEFVGRVASSNIWFLQVHGLVERPEAAFADARALSQPLYSWQRGLCWRHALAQRRATRKLGPRRKIQSGHTSGFTDNELLFFLFLFFFIVGCGSLV